VCPGDMEAGFQTGYQPEVAQGGGWPALRVHPGARGGCSAGSAAGVSRRAIARTMAPADPAAAAGTRTILVALAAYRSNPVACSSPRSADVALVASKIRKPRQGQACSPARNRTGFGDSLGGGLCGLSRASSTAGWVNPRVGDSVGTKGRERRPFGGRVVQTPPPFRRESARVR